MESRLPRAQTRTLGIVGHRAGSLCQTSTLSIVRRVTGGLVISTSVIVKTEQALGQTSHGNFPNLALAHLLTGSSQACT